MAVIVDELLVAQRLGADDEAGGSVGARPATVRITRSGLARTRGRQPVSCGVAVRRVAVVVAQPGKASVAAAEPRKKRRSMPWPSPSRHSSESWNLFAVKEVRSQLSLG